MLTDVRIPKGIDLNVKAVQVDKDYPYYEKLCEYEDRLYEDDTMYSADFESVHFEE